MLGGLRSRLTYANVMATIAVFIALGGTSVAALKVTSAQLANNGVRSVDIRNNDVRGKDIRNNDVRGGDIRNNDVRGKDIRNNDVRSGDLRDGDVSGTDLRDGTVTGGDVAPGALNGSHIANLGAGDFAPGQLPDPVPGILPSGKTLTGVFTAGVTGGDGDTGIGRTPLSFAFALASAPQATYVADKAPAPAQCPGNASNPRAAPGFLCLFETAANGSITLRGIFDPISAKNDQSSRFGAVAFVNGAAGASVRGTWAVTAP